MKLLAEFIGVLLGDGSISYYKLKSKNRIIDYYRLKISLNSIDDKDYSVYVKDLFYNLFGFYPLVKFRKNENVCELLTFKRDIINRLINIGLVFSPKWERAVIPKEFTKDELMYLVVRGYFDTDGCVTICNNNNTIYPRLEMKICPSPMQKQFKSYLIRHFDKVKFYDIGKGKVRMQLNGKNNLLL